MQNSSQFRTGLKPAVVTGVLIPLALAFCVSQTGAIQAMDEGTRKPSSGPEEMLTRFVKECVLITPGKGKLPAAVKIGSASPASHELSERQVSLTHAFRISAYETTQELYELVTGKNPSRWSGPRNSVERMTWQEANDFCTRLTTLLRARKLIESTEVVRLPTETEWEYCCRAGSNHRYSFGDDVAENGAKGTEILNRFAWHTGNAAGNDPAVGVLEPNDWGLYDVHGYLWEYVNAPLQTRKDGQDSTPTVSGEVKPETHIARGGSWREDYSFLTCASRRVLPTDFRGDEVGFRCVISAEPR